MLCSTNSSALHSTTISPLTRPTTTCSAFTSVRQKCTIHIYGPEAHTIVVPKLRCLVAGHAQPVSVWQGQKTLTLFACSRSLHICTVLILHSQHTIGKEAASPPNSHSRHALAFRVYFYSSLQFCRSSHLYSLSNLPSKCMVAVQLVRMRPGKLQGS